LCLRHSGKWVPDTEAATILVVQAAGSSFDPFCPNRRSGGRKNPRGTLKRPSIVEFFRPALRRTTLVTTLLVACTSALAIALHLYPENGNAQDRLYRQ
jgi:hypothetical protein